MNLEYLGKPEFEQLWLASRKTWERNGSLRGEAHLGPLTEAEAFELDGLLSWMRVRPRAGARLKVPLVKLNERLRAGELAGSLRHVLETLGGPLRDLPAERALAASSWEELWVEASQHPAAMNPKVLEWLEHLRNSGALKRAARGLEQEALTACLDVLATLPREGIELSRLASEVLGDAHGLDFATALGGLAGAALAYISGRSRPASAAAWRTEWTNVGVLCDALSCNVLALGLLPTGSGAVTRSLRLLTDAGEPAVVTLRQLTREPLEFPAETVFVCENPAVVSAAAEALGSASRPLVCGGGWPNTAVSALLDSLSASGCELRYQGDFDDEGAQIADHVRRRHGAAVWRFDVATYTKALAQRTNAPWAERLGTNSTAIAISSTGIAVYEEDIVEALIDDLRREQPAWSLHVA